MSTVPAGADSSTASAATAWMLRGGSLAKITRPAITSVLSIAREHSASEPGGARPSCGTDDRRGARMARLPHPDRHPWRPSVTDTLVLEDDTFAKHVMIDSVA